MDIRVARYACPFSAPRTSTDCAPEHVTARPLPLRGFLRCYCSRFPHSALFVCLCGRFDLLRVGFLLRLRGWRADGSPAALPAIYAYLPFAFLPLRSLCDVPSHRRFLRFGFCVGGSIVLTGTSAVSLRRRCVHFSLSLARLRLFMPGLPIFAALRRLTFPAPLPARSITVDRTHARVAANAHYYHYRTTFYRCCPLNGCCYASLDVSSHPSTFRAGAFQDRLSRFAGAFCGPGRVARLVP